jgi:hypothetical protein
LGHFLLTWWLELDVEDEDILSKKDGPRIPVSEVASELGKLADLRFGVPSAEMLEAGDTALALMSQTSPIRPSRRRATAYLFEEVSMLHASTRRGHIILVTGRNAPGVLTESTPMTLCERFNSYK